MLCNSLKLSAWEDYCQYAHNQCSEDAEINSLIQNVLTGGILNYIRASFLFLTHLRYFTHSHLLLDIGIVGLVRYSCVVSYKGLQLNVDSPIITNLYYQQIGTK